MLATGEICIVQISNEKEEDFLKIIDHLFPNPFVNVGIVVDNDVDVSSSEEIAWAISTTRVRPDKDIIMVFPAS